MKCIRRGTHKKIEDNLRRHKKLMDQMVALGADRDAASKVAFKVVTKQPLTIADQTLIADVMEKAAQ